MLSEKWRHRLYGPLSRHEYRLRTGPLKLFLLLMLLPLALVVYRGYLSKHGEATVSGTLIARKFITEPYRGNNQRDILVIEIEGSNQLFGILVNPGLSTEDKTNWLNRALPGEHLTVYYDKLLPHSNDINLHISKIEKNGITIYNTDNQANNILIAYLLMFIILLSAVYYWLSKRYRKSYSYKISKET
ncbi:hypothetical protein AB9P05_01580 [Roseivirga sp. BDSF3-8]|uniref:hypothetical protein n=1 Tax=Roseivirga sp. BDSF3-8 TaxID=3241598 RepID=UPI003531D1D3